MMANLRLVLDIQVQADNPTQSMHSLPGRVSLLKRLSPEHRPAFVRGDCDWSSDPVMGELERMNQDYLFKLKKSKHVNALISTHHSPGKWRQFSEGWQAKTDYLQWGYAKARGHFKAPSIQ